MSRKPPVRVEQHYYLDWLKEYGAFSLSDFAMTFDVSEATARRQLDGLIAQGKVQKHYESFVGVWLYNATEDTHGNTQAEAADGGVREGHSEGQAPVSDR